MRQAYQTELIVRKFAVSLYIDQTNAGFESESETGISRTGPGYLTYVASFFHIEKLDVLLN